VLRGPEDRGAVGDEFETQKASRGMGMGRGVPASPAGVWRSVVSSPPLEGSPEADFGAF